MPGAVLALESRAEPLDIDPRLVFRRIHLVTGRCEQQVDARLLCQPRVTRLVAWIGSQVVLLVELSGIDEEGNDDEVVLGPCGAEERQVTLVERPHRGHEPEVPGRPGRGPHLRRGAQRLHVASASVAPARVS